MGEGAGVLLLETEEHALKRGAKIYCELAGYAATCDAHHITTPHPEGMGLSDCPLLIRLIRDLSPRIETNQSEILDPACSPG